MSDRRFPQYRDSSPISRVVRDFWRAIAGKGKVKLARLSGNGTRRKRTIVDARDRNYLTVISRGKNLVGVPDLADGQGPLDHLDAGTT